MVAGRRDVLVVKKVEWMKSRHCRCLCRVQVCHVQEQNRAQASRAQVNRAQASRAQVSRVQMHRAHGCCVLLGRRECCVRQGQPPLKKFHSNSKP